VRIGLTGGAATADRIIQQAVEAEADGFTSLWYASAVFGDPLVTMALAGRATATIELGTAVLQTYTCHPVLQANRAASTAAAMGRAGLTLGVGPSHEFVIEDVYGLSYDDVGANTEEYVTVLSTLLRGEGINYRGEHYRVNIPAVQTPPQPVRVMVSALAPRLLRVAGELSDGTILWMANALAIERHVSPRSRPRHQPLVDPRRASSPVFLSPCTMTPRRLARPPPRALPTTGRCRTTAACSTSAARQARPTLRSWATKPQWPRRSKHSSLPERRTCGPPSFRSAAIGPAPASALEGC
jgi:Luciferase-like monooxygenase